MTIYHYSFEYEFSSHSLRWTLLFWQKISFLNTFVIWLNPSRHRVYTRKILIFLLLGISYVNFPIRCILRAENFYEKNLFFCIQTKLLINPIFQNIPLCENRIFSKIDCNTPSSWRKYLFENSFKIEKKFTFSVFCTISLQAGIKYNIGLTS